MYIYNNFTSLSSPDTIATNNYVHVTRRLRKCTQSCATWKPRP